MHNISLKIKYFLLITLGLWLGGISCMPGKYVKKEPRPPSIFDHKTFLEVKAYSFSEYKWTQNSKKAEELYDIGLLEYYVYADYDSASMYFNDALKIYPKDARIYVRLIECYARRGYIDDAFEIFKEGVRQLKGFEKIPGIADYYRELVQRQAFLIQEAERQRRSLLGTIWHGFKSIVSISPEKETNNQ